MKRLMALVCACAFAVMVFGAHAAPVREIEWDDLIPADFSFDALLENFDLETFDELEDDDPRAIEMYDQLMALWQQAPVVEALDGQTVHVLSPDRDVRIEGMFDTVWVTGVIRVEHKSSDLAASGYQIEVIEVTPYDE